MNLEQAAVGRKILNQITQHPETHDQRSWGRRTICGTTHCVAGWAVVLGRPDIKLVWQTVGVRGIAFPRLSGQGRMGDLPGEQWTELGAEILGLDRCQAWRLFGLQPEASAVAYLTELVEGAEREAAEQAVAELEALPLPEPVAVP